MLDTQMKTQLQAYLQNLRNPISLVATLDGGEKSAEMRELLEEIAGLSDKVSFEDSGQDKRMPSFQIVKQGEGSGVRFAAALEAQVRHYEVDIMNLQRAEKNCPSYTRGWFSASAYGQWRCIESAKCYFVDRCALA